jgi:hypothetical protein
MAIYESEHTRFMREFMAQRPGLAQEQKKGRALWWDRKPDQEEDHRNEASKIKMQAYVYQNKV